MKDLNILTAIGMIVLLILSFLIGKYYKRESYLTRHSYVYCLLGFGVALLLRGNYIHSIIIIPSILMYIIGYKLRK